MKTSLVLDSGAFSAWNRGVEIDLDAYIAFIKANIEWIDHYVNLDVIPGAFGRIPTLAEVEESASKGWENMLYMEEHGLRPMPVFHMGERFYWLDRMIDHGCDYVGISPANDRTTDQKRMWLDRVFAHIADSQGRPVIKTHGFGVTAIPLLVRYPWYSADSTSWALAGAYGMVAIPKRSLRGTFRYDVTPHVVVMSEQSSAMLEDGKHFDTFTPRVQEYIVSYLEQCGVTVQQARTSHVARARVNAIFFRDAAKHLNTQTFHNQRGLFEHEDNLRHQ